MKTLINFRTGCLLAVSAVMLPAQNIVPSAAFFAPADAFGAAACTSSELLSVEELSPHQRVCYFGQKLFSPSTMMHAAFQSASGNLRRQTHISSDGVEDFGRRFGVFYATRVAQDSSELLVGYLHREDPRFHPSRESGFLNRAKDVLLRVAVTRDREGSFRPAFAPIAGSLGSGLTAAALNRSQNAWEDGLHRSAFTYGGYLGTALLREFQPDLSSFANHLLRRKKQD